MTTPGEADGPIRTCIGCRQRHPQTRLLRCALDAAGEVVVDRHAPGRGAWLCGPDCVEPALRRRAFDRAFRTEVRADALVGIEAELAALKD